MNRRYVLTAAALAPLHAAAAKKPNIVIILADGFGYGSLNCYGADTKHIRTSNLDRSTGQGIRFTDEQSTRRAAPNDRVHRSGKAEPYQPS